MHIIPLQKQKQWNDECNAIAIFCFTVCCTRVESCRVEFSTELHTALQGSSELHTVHCTQCTVHSAHCCSVELTEECITAVYAASSQVDCASRQILPLGPWPNPPDLHTHVFAARIWRKSTFFSKLLQNSFCVFTWEQKATIAHRRQCKVLFYVESFTL